MRLHATDDVTILGEVKTGETSTGNPLTETRPILEARGRVDGGGTEWVILDTGERVRKSPTIVLPLHGTDPDTGTQADVLDVVETGQDVRLNDQDDALYRIEEVDRLRGRGHRVQRVELSVRKID